MSIISTAKKWFYSNNINDDIDTKVDNLKVSDEAVKDFSSTLEELIDNIHDKKYKPTTTKKADWKDMAVTIAPTNHHLNSGNTIGSHIHVGNASFFTSAVVTQEQTDIEELRSDYDDLIFKYDALERANKLTEAKINVLIDIVKEIRCENEEPKYDDEIPF